MILMYRRCIGDVSVIVNGTACMTTERASVCSTRVYSPMHSAAPARVSCRRALNDKMRPLLRAAAAIPPLALRADNWAPLTLLPYLVDALRHAGPRVQVWGMLTSPYGTVVLPALGCLERYSIMLRC